MNKLVRLCVVLGLAGLTISAQAGGVSTSLLSITGNLSGSSDAGGGVVLKQTIDQDAIINLAQGRSLGTPVPANEVLALLLECGGTNATLLVFDTTSGSNLVTLATSGGVVQVNSATKGIAGIPFQINSVGDGQNGIQSGTVVLNLKTSVSGGCVTKFSAAVSGVLDTIVTLPFGTFSNGVIVTKGKLSGVALLP